MMILLSWCTRVHLSRESLRCLLNSIDVCRAYACRHKFRLANHAWENPGAQGVNMVSIHTAGTAAAGRAAQQA
jgi:hypothetical protein